MKKLIEELHQSDIFGIFIENGAGLPLSTNLLSVENSSKTIYFSELPYNKEYFYSKYNIDKSIRSVSYQSLSKIIDYYLPLFNKNKINTIYSSSFQLNDNNKSVHGWIALKYKDKLFYYHITINDKLERNQYIERIGKNALKILASKNEYIPIDTDIDIVLNNDFTPNYEKTVESIINLENNEQFTLLKKDGIERIEVYLRNIEKVAIFKGSFNPVQKAHLYIMERLEKIYNTKPIFMISMNTYQKGLQDINSIIKRIYLLFELGYDVILCNKPFFKSNANFIRNKFNNKIIFALGTDTLKRLIIDYEENNSINMNKFIEDFNNIDFYCVGRSNFKLPDIFIDNNYPFFKYEETEFMELSSTQIRNLLKDKEYEQIKKFVPSKVYNKIIELYSI